MRYLLCSLLSIPLAAQHVVRDSTTALSLRSGNTEMTIEKDGFRFGFASRRNNLHIAAHPESGLLIGAADSLDQAQPIAQTSFLDCETGACRFAVRTKSGLKADVEVAFDDRGARMKITPEHSEPSTVLVQTAGAAPAYGLADHAGFELKSTDITGYRRDDFLSGRPGSTRLVSNFAIYPKHGFALVLLDPGRKIVRSSEREIVQGVHSTREAAEMHFFFGSPKEIYRAYLEVRNQRGYPVMQPKYEFFGVGWEAFGALGWETNHRTVTENVERYLDLGYPLRWMVVGSGFWPRHDPLLHATTSFGMYDPKLYPEPQSFIDRFHKLGLKFIHGLRISFIVGGPFSEEGAGKGYFLEENGKPQVFRIGFPKSPCYLLDAHKPEAVAWYMNLVRKWTDYGVDGFKEDLYGFGKYPLRDDKIDPVNEAMMKAGLFVMGRNGYIGSPADLHRVNDFNYDQNQDRGPINALALAYSGFPLVYPDIVGGTFGENRFDVSVTRRMKT
ncbi:MAG: TIM-barrel domain-containing protein, partial [Bryobacteraceae bacterium]